LASRSNRQRKLERARAERRIARRAERVRRKRQIQAGVGAAIALLLIAGGAAWALGAFSPTPPETIASGTCTWTLQDPKTNAEVVDTGHPPTTGELRSGFATLTFKTNLGEIDARMDLSKTPCTGASFNYLAAKKYYDNSTCYSLDTTQQVLACGDPKNDGTGNPDYQFANELLPSAPIATPAASPAPSADPSAAPAPTYYPKGTIVLLNAGASTNSGQFYIVYGDTSSLSNAYSEVGTITTGMDLVQTVADAGAAPAADGTAAPTGKPAKDLTIQSVTFSPVPGATPSGSPSPTTTPTVQPS
jgi:peptidyl-prolyl cis-trans isomerase B (cyclophilin B)